MLKLVQAMELAIFGAAPTFAEKLSVGRLDNANCEGLKESGNDVKDRNAFSVMADLFRNLKNICQLLLCQLLHGQTPNNVNGHQAANF